MVKNIVKVVFFFIFAGIFFGLFYAVEHGTLFFDEPVLSFFRNLRTEALTEGFDIITTFANTKTLIVVCAVLLFVPVTRYQLGIPLSIAAALTGIAGHIIKNAVERPRPDSSFFLISADGFSFPSGHSTAGFVFYFFLGLLITRYCYSKKKYLQGYLSLLLTSILILLIGVSRLYLGVHYPSDILGGFSLAAILLIVYIAVYDAFYPADYRIEGHS